jgi:transcriptional regulator with XRE-family HTH domain
MAFDYSKLRGRIKEMYGTQDAFAEAIGIGRVSLSEKLNNKVEFRQREINKSCEVLEIPIDEMTDYFFKLEVR